MGRHVHDVNARHKFLETFFRHTTVSTAATKNDLISSHSFSVKVLSEPYFKVLDFAQVIRRLVGLFLHQSFSD